jgi:hypothetical protein
MMRRPTASFGGGGSSAYFSMLTRPQQCAAAAKLSRAGMNTSAIAGLIGALRAQVEQMVSEDQATKKAVMVEGESTP